MGKAQKENKKKATLSSVVVKLAVFAAAVYLGVSFISGQLQVASMRRELDSVTTELNQRKNENLELQNILARGDENAYIERVAREKLGYAWPDERVFIDITGQ